MTKPMTDELLTQIKESPMGQHPRVREMIETIRRLREELKDNQEAFEQIGRNAEKRLLSAVEIVRYVHRLREENAKLRKVAELALDCWGKINRRKHLGTSFPQRFEKFKKALRELEKDDERANDG